MGAFQRLQLKLLFPLRLKVIGPLFFSLFLTIACNDNGLRELGGGVSIFGNFRKPSANVKANRNSHCTYSDDCKDELVCTSDNMCGDFGRQCVSDKECMWNSEFNCCSDGWCRDSYNFCESFKKQRLYWILLESIVGLIFLLGLLFFISLGMEKEKLKNWYKQKRDRIWAKKFVQSTKEKLEADEIEEDESDDDSNDENEIEEVDEKHEVDSDEYDEKHIQENEKSAGESKSSSLNQFIISTIDNNDSNNSSSVFFQRLKKEVLDAAGDERVKEEDFDKTSSRLNRDRAGGRDAATMSNKNLYHIKREQEYKNKSDMNASHCHTIDSSVDKSSLSLVIANL